MLNLLTTESYLHTQKLDTTTRLYYLGNKESMKVSTESYCTPVHCSAHYSTHSYK